MKYPVKLEGFEGQTVELESAGLISGAKLLVNGQPAPRKGNLMTLTARDGHPVNVTFKNNLFDVPGLVVDGKTVLVVQPLRWYEWLWNGLPALMVFGGGLIGAMIGVIALSINIGLFRSQTNPFIKYIVTGAVSFAAVVLYLAVALMISGALK